MIEVVVAIISGLTLIAVAFISRKVEKVHVLVNSRLATVLARVDQLTKKLESSNVAVPDAPPVPAAALRPDDGAVKSMSLLVIVLIVVLLVLVLR